MDLLEAAPVAAFLASPALVGDVEAQRTSNDADDNVTVSAADGEAQQHGLILISRSSERSGSGSASNAPRGEDDMPDDFLAAIKRKPWVLQAKSKYEKFDILTDMIYVFEYFASRNGVSSSWQMQFVNLLVNKNLLKSLVFVIIVFTSDRMCSCLSVFFFANVCASANFLTFLFIFLTL